VQNAQEAIDEAAEEGAVAHSSVYAGDYSWEVLLGKVPWPGIQKSKAKRKLTYDTNYRCEECSATLGVTYICATPLRMVKW
jgi:hypothetical protein